MRGGRLRDERGGERCSWRGICMGPELSAVRQAGRSLAGWPVQQLRPVPELLTVRNTVMAVHSSLLKLLLRALSSNRRSTW